MTTRAYMQHNCTKMRVFISLVCLSGLASGLVPSLPMQQQRRVSSSKIHPLSMTNDNVVDYGDDDTNQPMRIHRRMSNKLSRIMGRSDSDMNRSSSLFPKRSTSSSLQRNTTIPAALSFMFLLLQRITKPNLALATSASSTTTTAFISPPPAMAIGTQRILTFFKHILYTTLTSIRNIKLNKQGIKTVLSIGLSIWTIMNIITSIQASRRQKDDATSEWGRYADQPSARGMALTVLMMRLVPYTVLPILMEKISGKNKDTINNKEEYEATKAHELRKKGGQLFADGLLRLGPLYIKIGQILSCRENLFSDEWIAAMEKLQDKVPAKSGKEAWELLYDACPGGKSGFHKTFTDFDDVPLAAASLGQVHRARLRGSGERVAIKIQRSRLRDIYDKDLALMKKIASVADKLGKSGQVGGIEQSWEGIFNDAEEILYREIDYNAEAENAKRFATDFGIGLGGEPIESTAKDVDGKILPSAAEWLRTPYTFRGLSSEKFLVMEYVPSIKVNDYAKLTEAGVTIEDREYLAESLAHSYLRQFCTNNFFSTDPHPGNLGVEVFDDRAPRMVFYDFGQACSLSDDQAGGILEVIESIIDSDAKKSVAAFSRMGVLKDTANLEMVEAKCQQNYDTGKLLVKKRKKRKSSRYTKNVQQRSHLDELEERIEARGREEAKPTNATTITTEVDVKDVEVLESFTLQSEYAFVARALSQMDGVGKGLDPEFDFISASAPYIVEIKGVEKYLMDEAKKRLKFVYDKEDGILAKELRFFKSLGFNPDVSQVEKNEKKKDESEKMVS